MNINLNRMPWYHKLWFVPFAVIGMLVMAAWGLTFGLIISLIRR